MQTQITLKLSDEEKKLIESAANLIGLGHSSFCRMTALERAREVLNRNKE